MYTATNNNTPQQHQSINAIQKNSLLELQVRKEKNESGAACGAVVDGDISCLLMGRDNESGKDMGL